MKLRVLLLALVVALLSGGSAQAGYQFQFADSTGTAENSFVVNQGSTIDIKVYLVQTSPDTGLNTSGLDAAGVKLNYTGSVANVANAGAITGNPAFDSSFSSTTTNSAKLNVVNDSGGAPVTDGGTNRVLIGTFTFTGMTAGSTNLNTADPNPGLDDNVLHDGTVLDDAILQAATATITVQVVPEPGTMALTGLLATGIAGAALRRFRRGQPV